MTTPNHADHDTTELTFGFNPDQIVTIDMNDPPETHQLHQLDVVFISTKGAREHANVAELALIVRRFMEQDWGNLEYQEDIRINQQNAQRERGNLLGIYTAPDGSPLWVQQRNRFTPPTVMTPSEY